MSQMQITCSRTGTTKEVKTTARGKPRLPRGWKRIAGEVLSPGAYKEAYVVRGLKVPVAWPKEKDDQQRLASAVRKAQEEARRLANLTVSHLFAHDLATATWDKDGKLSKFQPVYLYPKLRAGVPEATTETVSAVEHRVSAIYFRYRWEVMTGRRSLPSFRSMAATIKSTPNVKWSIVEGKPRVLLTIARDQRFELTINRTSRGRRDGSDRRRHNRQFESLVRAIEQDLPLGEVHVQLGRRGNVFLTVVATLPKKLTTSRSGSLHIRTDRDSLLLALDAKGGRLWDYHADHLIRRQLAHKRRLQRWSDDSKHEDRPHPAFGERRSTAVCRHRDWLNTLVEQASARVVGYADRRRLARIEIDLTHDRMTDSFEWSRLWTRIEQKADAVGVEVEKVTGEESKKANGSANGISNGSSTISKGKSA